MIGSQLHVITKNMSMNQVLVYFGYGVLLTLALIVIRMSWIYLEKSFDYLKAYKNPKLSKECPKILSEAAILSWSGMRGIVSLIAALALPFNLPNGDPLPGRDVTIFLTFIVILLTLLIPGLTLPSLIRWLKIPPDHDIPKISEARKKIGQSRRSRN